MMSRSFVNCPENVKKPCLIDLASKSRGSEREYEGAIYESEAETLTDLNNVEKPR